MNEPDDLSEWRISVCRIEHEVERFQSLIPARDESLRDDLRFEGLSMAEGWKPFDAEIANFHLPRPDFFCLSPSCLAFPEQTSKRLCKVLNYGVITTGEYLPFRVAGEPFFAINITECINVLDQKASIPKGDKPGQGMIERYVFHVTRLGDAMPFSIPETCERELLTVERTSECEDEFKAAVEHLELTGLRFVKLWEGHRR